MIKNYFKYLLAIPALALVTACNTFDEIADAEDITPIGVKVDLEMAIENLAALNNLTLKFDNYEDDLHYVKEVTGNSIEIDSIVPGIYTVSVSGSALEMGKAYNFVADITPANLELEAIVFDVDDVEGWVPDGGKVVNAATQHDTYTHYKNVTYI